MWRESVGEYVLFCSVLFILRASISMCERVFLDASAHLYNWVCRSPRSAGDAFVKVNKNQYFRPCKVANVIGVILGLANALWQLYKRVCPSVGRFSLTILSNSV